MELSEILEIVSPGLEEVERELEETVKSQIPLVCEISRYLLGGGGKRIRPSILLLSSGACGLLEGKRRISAAASLELIHTATLLHDDVVDQGELRRGSPSPNVVWGNKPTVLVGDFMLAKALELIQSCGSIELVKVVTDASYRLAEGQILEVMSERSMIEVSEDACFSIIDRKTASLIEGCGRAGALLAETSNGAVEALSGYGRNIGMAFQLIDDALDYCSGESEFGKRTGQDLVERKMTLPLYYSVEKAPEGVRTKALSILEKEELESSDIAEIREIVSRYEGVALTRQTAKRFALDAKKSIGDMKDSGYKKSLGHLAEYVVERDF